MTTTPQGTEITKQGIINPLRRVFVPIEKRTTNGTLVFKTHDNAVYARLDDGSIRRAVVKTKGKAARAADKVQRRRMMKAGDDPRTDQHPDREGGKYADPPANSQPSPAPGGVGTGTKNDPADDAAAQPGKHPAPKK